VIDDKEIDALIDTLLDAVHKEFIEPQTMALCVLTVAVSRDKDAAKLIAATFRSMAEACSADQAAPRALLSSLSLLAASPAPVTPDDVKALLSTAAQPRAGRRSREH
jgi:hypothetical protein